MKTLLKTLNNICTAFMLLLALCLSSSAVLAQGYNLNGFSNNDVTEVAGSGTPDWLNNSEFTNVNGTLYGVVWDNGGNIYYNLSFSTFSTGATAIALPVTGGSAVHPDIVLGGNYYNNNYMAITYTFTIGGVESIYINVYTITLTSSGITVSPICTTYIYNLSGSNTAGNVGSAHIDAANTLDYPNASAALADRFVVAWEDKLCTYSGGNYGARTKSGSFSNIAANCPTPTWTVPTTTNQCVNNTAATNGASVDVAGYYRTATGYRADFVYRDPASDAIYERKWNLTPNALNPTVNTIDNGGSGTTQYPRIDVPDWDPASGYTNLEVVYNRYNTTNSVWEVIQTNDLQTQTATAYYNLATYGTFYNNNTSPVVTCGPNDNSFSLAYASPLITTSEIWAQGVSWVDGKLFQTGGPNVQYWAVNQTSTAGAPVAITNDWIWGSTHIAPGEIFVCWYNSTYDRIDCKTSASAYAFKPTRLTSIPLSEKARISPNPATGQLFVMPGKTEVTDYSISDVLGRTLLQGKLDNGGQAIDIQGLKPGIYILNINYKGNISGQEKFIKE